MEKATEQLNNSKTEKKSSKKGCLIVALILIVAPALSVFAFYNLNKDFNMSLNSILSNVPGPVGAYFEKFPTSAEQQTQIREISDYMLSIETARAVDKLLVLKSQDSAAYDDVVKDMLRINPNRTKTILETIRNQSITSDALTATVEQIDSEKTTSVQETADYWSELPVTATLSEVQTAVDSSINGYKDVAAIFDLMDTSAAEQILYQMDTNERNKIFSNMSDLQAISIKNLHASKNRRVSDLEQIASVYASEDADTLILTLGNTSIYSEEELAVIYKNLGPKKAGEVLAKSIDDEFVFSVIQKIQDNEILSSGEDKITPDVLKSLKIYKEFDDNVGELVQVYSKMSTDKVAEIVKNMMLNASPSEVYELNNGEFISISDEMLILEILNNFNESKKAEILSLLDNTLSTELTRKLALPKN